VAEYTKLITALAALVGAIAWPTAFLVTIFAFKRPIVEAFARMRKGKMGIVEVELDQLAREAEGKTSEDAGAVTIAQVRSAARIEARSVEIGKSEILGELDRLCIEYDSLRRAMRPSRDRTAAMTEILVKMRALGPSVIDRLGAYKSSGSAGSRLAAIAAMQMLPDYADVGWLVERFRDDQPFLFYHAALALNNSANAASGDGRKEIVDAARRAKEILMKFNGTPDQNALSVLDSILGLNTRL
jgi:hypothetical protein